MKTPVKTFDQRLDYRMSLRGFVPSSDCMVYERGNQRITYQAATIAYYCGQLTRYLDIIDRERELLEGHHE